MVNSKNKGIAIRVSDRNSYGMLPVDIINEHYIFTQNNNSPVYFSTNTKQDCRFNKRLEKMILFFNDGNQVKYVGADIVKVESGKKPFIPENSEKFSPDIFKNDKRCSWYLIENLIVLEDSDVAKYYYRNNNTLLLEPLSTVLNRPRFPKCYFEERKATNNGNLL